MTKRMLVDATHPEETRVAIVDGTWLNDFDFERASKKQLKGNIYLAKVIRIEPSLQAAFVEYGGNRHGFLPFSEIHPDYFRIPMADRPQDEEAPEEEAEEPTSSEDEDENATYAADISAHQDMADDHAHDLSHDHELDHVHEELVPLSETPLVAEAISADAVTASYVAPADSEFTSGTAPDDLGLITDFGNAAVGEPMTVIAAEPAPVEVIGGEEGDVERYRHPPRMRYKIQEVVKRRQVMLIQVVKEERGNKGAALTTFLSLAGRYCVLMPNTDRGGGVSRKITSHQDRRRMKEILDQLEIPDGMAVILRTAGMEQEIAEIQRDLEYLLRLWNNIREQTLQSTAPALIYEEANLIKRSMRDLMAADVQEILVAGEKGHQLAHEFMRTIMPDQLEKVKLYEDTVPLFFRYNVEKQIDALYSPTVQLRSGGYIVINPTEALVSIDVNSGRATRERNIEGTALRTNMEAAEEIARQLRLRDLAGLVVIDFIDMEDGRNNAAVERRVKDAMRADRARLQIGRISPFGLLELSRQRLHPSLMEINFERCPHCIGTGLIRSVDSAALSILRMIEEEGIRYGAIQMVLHVPTNVALYILNQKRLAISEIERRYGLQVLLHSDDALVPPDFRLERVKPNGERIAAPAVNSDQILADIDRPAVNYSSVEGDESAAGERNNDRNTGGRDNNRRRNRSGKDRNRNDRIDRPNNGQPHQQQHQAQAPVAEGVDGEVAGENIGSTEGAPVGATEGGNPQDQQRRGRRRGRRGGRGRRNGPNGPNGPNGNGGLNGDRPPRDGNYQPRPERQGNWNNGNDSGAQHTPPMAAHNIPASVHDIDTTPRAPYTPRANTTPSQHSASSAVPYEVVNQPPEKPKGGWWRRITGQE